VVISNYLKLALMTALATCAAVALLSPLLLPLLYGRTFSRSVVPLLLLLPGTVVMCGSVVGLTCLTALGTPGRATLAEVAGLVVTVAGMPLVIFRYGIVGAAVLSTASYLVTFGLYLYYLSRHGRLDLRPRASDAGALWTVFSRELIARAPAAGRILGRAGGPGRR
jgi:O-antigen/teichoic acid export membrane protein